MTTNQFPLPCVILYEGTGSVPAASELRLQIVNVVLNFGYEILVTRDIKSLKLDATKSYLVLGCFTDEFLVIDGDPIDYPNFMIKSIGYGQCELIQNILEKFQRQFESKKPGTWKPWFPVIDYGRCTNCLQCLSFCLFDVYGLDSQGKINVQNPSKCKSDCPACSRVCPEVAIIFPKYKSGPINGDEVSEDDYKREKMKVDISSLLGGDIYKTLRDRNERAKSRFSAERDEGKALEERKRCLKELQESLDIPEEVLNSLPDLTAIQAKAKQKQQSS